VTGYSSRFQNQFDHKKDESMKYARLLARIEANNTRKFIFLPKTFLIPILARIASNSCLKRIEEMQVCKQRSRQEEDDQQLYI
jgi:hypothetical protein